MDAKILDTIQETILGALGIGLCFIALFIIFKAIQLKNKERMALIEKGMDPTISEPHIKRNKLNSLKNGLLMVGVAVGLLFGYILERIFTDIPEFVAYSSMILICGGAGLIYYHMVIMKSENE